MIVGIVGSGRMAVQITSYLLEQGLKIIIKIGNISRKTTVLNEIDAEITKNHNTIKRDENNFECVTHYKKLSKCDLIIETSKEDLNHKKDIFSELSNTCSSNVVLATNTSSISLTDLCKNVNNPSRLIGCHFFNPVSKMKLVEVIITQYTSVETKIMLEEFVKSIGKTPVIVNNSPGFVVNRLLLPQINDAIKLTENKTASKEDIDIAIKLGLNHPMGPFELADLIGLDVCYQILNEIYLQTGNKYYLPSKQLAQLISEGKYGRKTGEGFYKY